MFSKKFTIALFFSLPLFWLLFILTPKYLLPADCFLDNFIYAENIIKHNSFRFDKFTLGNFDDTGNFLYILLLSLTKEITQYTIYSSGLLINGISLFLSFIFLARAVNSRHSNVNSFMMFLLFLSYQIWASLLGDGILFQGLLYILIARSFWHKRYAWILIWFVLNTINNPINAIYLFPLIVASYVDVLELKPRQRRGFYLTRLRKTFFWLIIPMGAYLGYRKLYFGQFLPEPELYFTTEKNSKILFFDKSALYMCWHYIRFYIMPLMLGVLFYFFKQKKSLSSKHYAVLISYIILPIIITSLHAQTKNLAYRNYYIIYLGLLILSFIFIRDFRSLTQKTAIGIFILFYALPQIKSSIIQYSQTYNNNSFRIADELSTIRHANIIAYYDNYFSYITNWKTIYANGKHQPKANRKLLSNTEIEKLNADLIIPAFSSTYDIENYILFKVPENLRQYAKEMKPSNSLDLIFYEFRKAYPIKNFKYFDILVNNNTKNYAQIKSILKNYGAKEVLE